MVWWRARISRLPPVDIDRRTHQWFVLIAFLDTFASTLILCGAVFISAPLATLLSQGVIPITMLASMWWLRRRFHCNHWLGAALIVCANGASIVLLYLGVSGKNTVDVTPTSDAVPNFVWALVFFVSNVPIAASSIAKEVLMISNMSLDQPTLNAWVSFYQFLFSILLAPCVFYLQHIDEASNLGDLPRLLWRGVQCTLWFS